MKRETNKIGVKDIARLAEVSIGTVDRVLHNRPGVSDKTRKKVLDLLQMHDYTPNIMAQALTKRNVKRFLVVLPHASPESAYWEYPLLGVRRAEQEITKYGVELVLVHYDQGERSSFLDATENVDLQRYHGVVIAPMFQTETLHFLRRCDELSIPYLFVNSDVDSTHRLAYYGPDLYQSGYAAAQLANFLTPPDGRILLLNISKEIDANHHLYVKGEGFAAFFTERAEPPAWDARDIRGTDYTFVAQEMEVIMEEYTPIVIVVTNSRVATVAKYLEQKSLTDIVLIGFDFLPDNIHYLEKEVIDFLICHTPIEQGYKSVLDLFNYAAFGHPIAKHNYTPIDIITKVNYTYYDN